MSSKLEPVIWLRVLVTLAYMKGRTDVRTENDVMAILPNFLPSMTPRQNECACSASNTFELLSFVFEFIRR